MNTTNPTAHHLQSHVQRLLHQRRSSSSSVNPGNASSTSSSNTTANSNITTIPTTLEQLLTHKQINLSSPFRKAYCRGSNKVPHPLRDWQRLCVWTHGSYKDNHNVVISAPTSAGKTLVGELLCILTLSRALATNDNGPALTTTALCTGASPPLALVAMPLVSLVRQKAKEWSNKEGSGGGLGRFDDIRVGVENEDQKTPKFVCGALLSGNGGGGSGADGGVALQVHLHATVDTVTTSASLVSIITTVATVFTTVHTTIRTATLTTPGNFLATS